MKSLTKVWFKLFSINFVIVFIKVYLYIRYIPNNIFFFIVILKQLFSYLLTLILFKDFLITRIITDIIKTNLKNIKNGHRWRKLVSIAGVMVAIEGENEILKK